MTVAKTTELRNIAGRLDFEERRIRAKQKEIAELIAQKEHAEQAQRTPNPKGIRALGREARE